MLKFCIYCGKEFDGNGDVCQDCQQATTIAKTSPDKAAIKIKEKISTKVIMIIAAGCIGVIALLIAICMVAGNSQGALNNYAKKIYDASVGVDTQEIYGAKAIDSIGNLIYGDAISEHLISGGWELADSPEKIESAEDKEFINDNNYSTACFSFAREVKSNCKKAEELRWIILFGDNGEVDTVVCSKTKESNKKGVFSKNQNDFSYDNIDSFKSSQEEQQKQAIKEYKQALMKDAKLNQNASMIEEYIVSNYRPDGIDKCAVYSNLKKEYDNPAITSELSKKIGGYWVVKYYFETNNIDEKGFCNVYWAEDNTSSKVGESISHLPLNELPDGIEGVLAELKPECSLISCSDWDKKYGKEYGEITEIKEHSFGIKDAFIDNLDRKLSSLMSTKLQFVKQESAGNNSTRYDYTYLDGAVKLTLVEKYGFVTMVNTSTEISMEKTAKDNETQLWTGIVNTCYFPIAVFENYSDKDKVCETFLNNYSKDAKGTITVSGDSYTATLYDNGIDGTLVSFLPK